MVSNMAEFNVVVSRHADIKVIIPRHKTTMPDCTQKTAPIRKVSDIMFLADSVNFGKNVQSTCPGLFDCSWNVESVSDFVAEKIDAMIHPAVYTQKDWSQKVNPIFRKNVEREGILLC